MDFTKLFFVLCFFAVSGNCLPVETTLRQEILNATFHPLFYSALIQNNHLDILRELSNSQEFNIEFPEESEEGFILSKDLFQGDIMLTTEQKESARQGQRDTRSRWNVNGKRIPYWIDPNYPQDARDRVLAGIQRWNDILGGCCVRIEPWRNGDNDWVHVINDNGCWSYMGRLGGRQALSLQANGCTSTGTIIHEFMHAAGVIHEQGRPDRDDSLTIHYENIKDEWKGQFHKSSDDYAAIFAPYDYYSVMHYPRVHSAYSIDNKPAFTCRRNCDHNRIGNGNDISVNDVAVLKKMYSC